jgi:hypothetical protein
LKLYSNNFFNVINEIIFVKAKKTCFQTKRDEGNPRVTCMSRPVLLTVVSDNGSFWKNGCVLFVFINLDILLLQSALKFTIFSKI